MSQGAIGRLRFWPTDQGHERSDAAHSGRSFDSTGKDRTQN